MVVGDEQTEEVRVRCFVQGLVRHRGNVIDRKGYVQGKEATQLETEKKKKEKGKGKKKKMRMGKTKETNE